MNITEAIHAVSDEYNADTERARSSAAFHRLMKQATYAEYEEIDQELPSIVADIARGMGVPEGTTLPDYVYQACRMSFRLGMRVQRKLDHPDQPTTALWRDNGKPPWEK